MTPFIDYETSTQTNTLYAFRNPTPYVPLYHSFLSHYHHVYDDFGSDGGDDDALADLWRVVC